MAIFRVNSALESTIDGGEAFHLGTTNLPYASATSQLFATGFAAAGLRGEFGCRVEAAGEIFGEVGILMQSTDGGAGDNVITIRSGGLVTGVATAISLAGTGNVISNAGDLSGNVGVASAGGVARLTNTGTITATTTAANLLGGNGVVVNAGTITAGATAVALDGIGNRVTNSGLISDNIGVDSASSAGSQATSIVNTGTISGTVLAVQGGAGIETLTNRGTILGDVQLGDGADEVDSRGGSISGGVELGDDDDSFDGRGGADRMTGFGGNDLYVVDRLGDRVDEARGDGVDTVRSSVSFSVAAGSTQALGSVERIELTGTAATSATGNDLANRLTGNAGANTLTGGAGGDTFRFVTALATANADTIADFEQGVDGIALDDAVMPGIGPAGVLDPARFWASAAGVAHDDTDRIVFDTDDGRLWYDPDGTGAQAAVRIARLAGSPGLGATDVLVI